MSTSQTKKRELFSNHDVIDYPFRSTIEIPDGVNVDPLESEKIFFELMKPSLKADTKYQNQFIAILNNKIIGNGNDSVKLGLDMYKQHGYQPILIRKIDHTQKYTTSPRF